MLPVAHRNGHLLKTILIPKYLQKAGFPADSIQVVGRVNGKLLISNLQEDKVTATPYIDTAFGKLTENVGHQSTRKVNVPLIKLYTLNPYNLGTSILLKVPKAPNAFEGLLHLASNLNKDVSVDVYSRISTEEFGVVNDTLMSNGLTPAKMIQTRNEFIKSDLGFGNRILKFGSVKQTTSSYLQYHNVRVVNIIANRSASLSVSVPLKTVLMGITKNI